MNFVKEMWSKYWGDDEATLTASDEENMKWLDEVFTEWNSCWLSELQRDVWTHRAVCAPVFPHTFPPDCDWLNHLSTYPTM